MFSIKMDCGPGKFRVKEYTVKPSCRKAKGGILGQQLRNAIKVQKLKVKMERAKIRAEKKLAKEQKAIMKSMDTKRKRKASTEGGVSKKMKI